MKKRLLILAILLFIGCNSNSSTIGRNDKKIAKLNIERSYLCAEIGYSYAKYGKSKQELFDYLKTVIGERPKGE